MNVKFSYLGATELLELCTPEETWNVVTTATSHIKDYLETKGIKEFTLGKVYMRIDIKNRFTDLQDGLGTKLISSTIESINVMYKETEDSDTKSVRFKVRSQHLIDVREVFEKARDKAYALSRDFKLLLPTDL